MDSHIDFPGDGRSHGYTRDDNGNVWYWTAEDDGVEFRESGYPMGHPIRDGGVPDRVREHARDYAGRGDRP